jgi:hypothetical protein
MKTALAAIALGITSLVSASALAGPVFHGGYVAPAQPAYVAPAFNRGAPWQNPQTFAARTRGRMNEIDADVRARVQRGGVQPQALNALANHRSRVEAALSYAAADGVIAQVERRQINDLVEDMNRIDERFRMRRGGGPNGYGNGGYNNNNGGYGRGR